MITSNFPNLPKTPEEFVDLAEVTLYMTDLRRRLLDELAMIRKTSARVDSLSQVVAELYEDDEIVKYSLPQKRIISTGYTVDDFAPYTISTLIGSGTNNYIPKFVVGATPTFGDSIMSQSGTVVTAAGSFKVDGAADVVQFTVDMNATQTADTIQVRQSDGDIVLKVTNGNNPYLQIYGYDTTSTAWRSWYFQTDTDGRARIVADEDARIEAGIVTNNDWLDIVARSGNTIRLRPTYGGSGESPAGAMIGGETGNLTIFPDILSGGAGHQLVLSCFDGSQHRSVVEYANVAAGSVPSLLLCKNVGKVGINTGTATLVTPFTTLLTDAVTNAVSNVVTIGHDSSGTPAAGFGAGILGQLESSTTASQDAAQIAWSWTDATHATRTSKVEIFNCYNGTLTGFLHSPYSITNLFLGHRSGKSTTTGTDNLAFGSCLRNITSGTENVAIGSGALDGITTQTRNFALGTNAGATAASNRTIMIGVNAGILASCEGGVLIGYDCGKNTTGDRPVFIGAYAGNKSTSGDNVVGIGRESVYAMTTADNTTACGAYSLRTLTTAGNCTAFGHSAGYTCDASGGLFLGYQAGYYETGASKLFIDNAQRASEADGRIKALIYGIFAAANADQYLYLNSNVIVNEDGQDCDFRVETADEANTIFCEGSTNYTYIGGTTNGVRIEQGGNLTLLGTATQWEDLRIEPVARTTGGNAPTFEKWYDDAGASSRGVYLYSFDDAVGGSEKEVFFSMQMPHAWAGTAISMHVHWVGAVDDTTADPRWGLEYIWKDIGEVYGDTAIVYTDGTHFTPAGDDANVTAHKHYISDFAALTPGTTADGLSSILIGRLFRDSANGADTYNATGAKCGLLYIDAHYEVNSFGSNLEYTK